MPSALNYRTQSVNDHGLTCLDVLIMASDVYVKDNTSSSDQILMQRTVLVFPLMNGPRPLWLITDFWTTPSGKE